MQEVGILGGKRGLQFDGSIAASLWQIESVLGLVIMISTALMTGQH